MVIIRRLIFIMVLLWLAFVFYRFIDAQWADNLIARLRWVDIDKKITDIQNQIPISTWNSLTWEISTWTSSLLQSGVSNWTWTSEILQSGDSDSLIKSSWEIIWLVDNMDWFSEIIDSTASQKTIQWDLNYKNTDYKFSMTFPWSRDGYTLQINTWDDVKAELIFAFDSKDYFLLYVIPNAYYKSQKTRDFGHLTYLAQDTTNTFAYKILENTDTKSKAIPYILKTFKIQNSASNTPVTVPATVKPTVKTTTVPKTTSSDWNYLKNIFDSFVK